MSFADRLSAVVHEIAAACQSVGRSRDEITLIAVSKTHPVESIREAYDLGLRHFGESRLQEALPKIEALPTDITWHFIGHLQSNKAKRVAQRFDVIHTLSSDSQLHEIAKAGRVVDGFVEVNVANEAQKSGIPAEMLDVFVPQVLNSPSVRFRGLMTVGPALEDPEGMRPFFRRLSEENRRVNGNALSMGMSGDFAVAIQEGASHIRVGTALFGVRPKPTP